MKLGDFGGDRGRRKVENGSGTRERRLSANLLAFAQDFQSVTFSPVNHFLLLYVLTSFWNGEIS